MGGKGVCAVGHRGAAGLVPENTLEGFRYAISLGVDAVECDVHLTGDGKLIVIHDETVDRTTNGTGAVAQMPLAEIRALDAGKGQSPPTLEEVLETVRGRCGLLCELKADGTEAPAVEAVRARGMGGDVLFISFGLERLANVKGLGKDLRVGALLVFPTARNIRRALDVGACHLGVLYRRLSLEAVDRARAAGVDIGAWTVNSPEEMKAVIALGVDCITSDRPDLLLEHLGRRKQA